MSLIDAQNKKSGSDRGGASGYCDSGTGSG